MNTYVIGDIHGAYKALEQCIERSGIDKDSDRLICLGDVADSWPEVPECFDKLLEFKQLDFILGNHDYWLLEWFRTRYTPHIWTSQGGKATLEAYERLMNMMEFDRMDKHQELLEKALYYLIDDKNRVFVHGGINWHIPLKENNNHDLMWDRKMVEIAYWWERRLPEEKFKDYEEIFVGHTTTSWHQKDLKPVHASNLWNLDQGAGWEGKLTLMDVDTKEYWQSDNVNDLYPNYRGRKL